MSLDLYLSVDDRVVFNTNITHNLAGLATAAGVYEPLWRPKAAGITKAGRLAEAIHDGLVDLALHPSKYKEFDAHNDWGTYAAFLLWLGEVYETCEKFPHATVGVSR